MIYHHATDSHNTETFEPPNETEAAINTQVFFASHIDNIIKQISFSRNECTLGLWSRHNFVKRLNLEGSQ